MAYLLPEGGVRRMPSRLIGSMLCLIATGALFIYLGIVLYARIHDPNPSFGIRSGPIVLIAIGIAVWVRAGVEFHSARERTTSRKRGY